MKPEVLVVCGDPGGAAAVAPVTKWLEREGRVRVRSAVYRQAAALWSRLGLAHQALPDNMNDGDLLQVVGEARALLLGTSVNGVDYERRLGELVPERTVAVLDFWSNYTCRFRSPRGGLAQPAKICVMDEQARAEMLAEGFEDRRLVITGQPAFDDLAALRQAFIPQQRKKARATWEVGENDTLVVFASQPFAELYARPELLAGHPGYDADSVLRLLVGELDRLAREIGRGVMLLVRPHPREDAQNLAWVEQHAGAVRIRVRGDGDARVCALAADLVCGMTSALLVEACYLGCLTLSIQPGLAGPDLLPTNRAGLSVLVRDVGELRRTLHALLTDSQVRAQQTQRLASLRLDGQSARRVAATVYQLLEERKAG